MTAHKMKTAKSQTKLKENLLHPTKGELSRLNKFDYKEVRKGIAHEKEEHTRGLSKKVSDTTAAKIVGDHLEDDPEYYEKLEKAKIEDVMSFDFFAVSEAFKYIPAPDDEDTPIGAPRLGLAVATEPTKPSPVKDPVRRAIIDAPPEQFGTTRPSTRGKYDTSVGGAFERAQARDKARIEKRNAKRAEAKAAKAAERDEVKNAVVPGKSYFSSRKARVITRARDVLQHVDKLSKEGRRDTPLDREGVKHHIELHGKKLAGAAAYKGSPEATAERARFKRSNYKGKSITTKLEGPWLERKPQSDAVAGGTPHTLLGKDSTDTTKDIVGDAIIGNTPTSDKTVKATKFMLGALRRREKRVADFKSGKYKPRHNTKPEQEQRTESIMKKSYYNQLIEAYNLSYSQLQGGIKNNVTKRERTAGHLQGIKNSKAAYGTAPPKLGGETSSSTPSEAPKMASVFSRSVGGGQDFTRSPLELKANKEAPRDTGFSAGMKAGNVRAREKYADKPNRDSRASILKTAFVRGGGTPKSDFGVKEKPASPAPESPAPESVAPKAEAPKATSTEKSGPGIIISPPTPSTPKVSRAKAPTSSTTPAKSNVTPSFGAARTPLGLGPSTTGSSLSTRLPQVTAVVGRHVKSSEPVARDTVITSPALGGASSPKLLGPSKGSNALPDASSPKPLEAGKPSPKRGPLDTDPELEARYNKLKAANPGMGRGKRISSKPSGTVIALPGKRQAAAPFKADAGLSTPTAGVAKGDVRKGLKKVVDTKAPAPPWHTQSGATVIADAEKKEATPAPKEKKAKKEKVAGATKLKKGKAGKK